MPTPADDRTKTLLSSIDNALRTGSHMNNANLAFEYLCDALGVDRDSLPPFDPYWTTTLGCWHGDDCAGTGPDCAPTGPITPTATRTNAAKETR